MNLQSLGTLEAKRLKDLALAAQGASMRSAEQSASHGAAHPQGVSQGHDNRAIERAFELALDAQNIPAGQRDALRAAFEQQLAARQAAGERFAVKVYDINAAPAARQTLGASEFPRQTKPERTARRTGPQIAQ